MVELKLISIEMEQFKQHKDKYKVEFDGYNWQIRGSNGVGKTTIQDAYLWTLFGKDSLGRADFDIKPLGLDKPKVKTSILLEVNGKLVSLGREYTEIWMKSQDTGVQELKGHSTKYYINEVEKSAKEYKAYLDTIVTESLFRMITDANVFLGLKRQDMRKALVDLVGGIDSEKVAGENETLKEFHQLLIEKEQTPEALLDTLDRELKSIGKQREDEQSRLSELSALAPEEQDWGKIEKGISTGERFIEEIDRKLVEAGQVHELEKQISEVELRIDKHKLALAANAGKDKEELLKEKARLELILKALESKVELNAAYRTNADKQLLELKAYLKEMEGEYKQVQAEIDQLGKAKAPTLDKDSAVCEMCSQTLPKDKIAELNLALEQKHKSEVKEKLVALHARRKTILAKAETRKGQAPEIKATLDRSGQIIDEATNDLGVVQNELAIVMSKLDALEVVDKKEVDYSKDQVFRDLKTQLNALVREKEKLPTHETTELFLEKSKVTQQLATLKGMIDRKEENERALARLKELEEQAEQTASAYSETLRYRNMAREFLSTRNKLIESEVNKRFKHVSFKLFSTNLDGKEVDDCLVLVNGVGYNKGASTGERARANMEIVDVFQKAHGYSLPYFGDDAESCDWIPDMGMQVIELFKPEIYTPDLQFIKMEEGQRSKENFINKKLGGKL